MSGRITTPAPGLVAGSAYAAEKRGPPGGITPRAPGWGAGGGSGGERGGRRAAVGGVNRGWAPSPRGGGGGGGLWWWGHRGGFSRPAPRRARRAVAPGPAFSRRRP